MGRLKDKVALVTGASSGLGREVSKLFAKEGAKVVLTDIDEEGGQEVVNEINKNNGDAVFFAHDVTQENEWKSIIDKTLSQYNKLNILVNSAGILELKNIETSSYSEWRKVINLNLDSVFLGTQYGISGMKKNNSIGSIINISSILGLVGEADAVAYNASKGGVKLLSKSSALHCAKENYNIRVNSVHPGYIGTAMVEDEVSDGLLSKEELSSLHPVGHLGESIDVAYGILYLASDESKFVTGSELVIDGGYTAQ